MKQEHKDRHPNVSVDANDKQMNFSSEEKGKESTQQRQEEKHHQPKAQKNRLARRRHDIL